MAEYRNRAQYGETPVTWDPAQQSWSGAPETAPGYLSTLLQYRDLVRAGKAQDFEAEQYRNWEAEARQIPTRDIASLTAGWQGEHGGQWTDSGWQEGNADWWTSLDPGSPDVGPIMLALRDKLDAGTATPQEQALYQQVLGMAQDWNWRASVPQPSDAFNPLGDQFFGALGTLALGATGGLAAAPLAAGGASLATTLGSLGTLSGIAGTGAGVLGQATDQDWLRTLGLALGAAGGVAGGASGLANLWGTGVRSLGDAARLAQSAGRITGAVGTASGQDALKQAAGYLSMAGQLGSAGSGVLPTSVTDWSTQRGGPMDWLDYSWDYGDANPAGAAYDNWSVGVDPTGGGAWTVLGDTRVPTSFLGWGGDETQQGWYQGAELDTGGSGGGSWLSSVLGSLGGLRSVLGGGSGGTLGGSSAWLGPLLSTLSSLGGGALGAHASSDAAAAQTAALNRGLSLQEAQWLQSQANQAPWMQAGREGLEELRWRLANEQATPPEARAAISGANYALPRATPGWTPSTYAGYTPTDTPSAAGFRYTPGAVPTLSGAELLANDPGVQFRLDEGRRALEASAAARGGLTSGATLAALQRQGQELSSQEYGNAWNRAAEQARLREGWGQTASQLGWTQAEAEARLRAQQAQYGWDAGFRAQQQGQNEQRLYETDLYNRLMEQNKLTYGRDVYTNETDEARRQQLYTQQLAEMVRQWNQASGISGLGQTSVGQLGTQGQTATTGLTSLLTQLGTAQAGGQLGQGNSWLNALQNVGSSIQGGLQNNALLSALSRLNT